MGVPNWWSNSRYGCCPPTASPTFARVTKTCMPLNASNGEKLWNFPVPVDRDSMSPAVCNGVVYVDSGGELYAVNASEGKLMWNFDIGGSTGYDPVVVGGVVYACASGGSLYALNASSGKQLWNFPISGDLAVADGVIYISSGPTFSNGRLLSQRQLHSGFRSSLRALSFNLAYTNLNTFAFCPRAPFMNSPAPNYKRLSR